MTGKLILNANVKSTGSKNYSENPIAETLTNGFFTVDRNWTVKYWNKAAEIILGVPAKDIIGKNLWGKFGGILPLEFYTVYYKAFLKDIPVHFEEYWEEMGAWFDVITYHCDDSLSVSFKSSNHPHSGYPENPVQRLKVLSELYKFVTEITNDCLWEWDLQTKEIFWIDGGHKRVMGYQIENALIPQRFWENCIHPDDKVRVLAGLNKTITEGSACLWEDEYRFKKANGEYAYIQDRGHIIFDEDKKAARMIGASLDITENVVLEKKLTQERQTRQRAITDAVLTAQENERATIGRELHDNLNQLLVAAKWNIQIAKKDEDKREICLDKSFSYIVDVIEQIRKISKTLVVPDIRFIGLFDNIKSLVADINKIHPIKVEFYEKGIDEEEDLDEKIQLDIFRIVQEQLTNILKHAKATHAIITLTKQANEIILLISDNGEGCDILKEKNGVGIINIKSRAELYGGAVTIVSEPGEGYELEVSLPLSGHV
jgi:PAS domain S-box-containing protein